MPHIDFAVGIGGAAGQGVATPGNILAKLFARRGLHINAYNAYQSIIRGGHTFLTISSTSALLPQESANRPSLYLAVSHSSRLVKLLKKGSVRSIAYEHRKQRRRIQERVPARDAVA